MSGTMFIPDGDPLTGEDWGESDGYTQPVDRELCVMTTSLAAQIGRFLARCADFIDEQLPAAGSPETDDLLDELRNYAEGLSLLALYWEADGPTHFWVEHDNGRLGRVW